MANTPIPTRGPDDVSLEYGDDRSSKEVFFQAAGLRKNPDPSKPRPVLIYWVNATLGGGIEVWDTTQLEPHGHWHQYHYPNACKVNSVERTRNQTISLGTFTSEQREELLELAADVEYDELATDSRAWMHKLLAKMVGAISFLVVCSTPSAGRFLFIPHEILKRARSCPRGPE